MFLKSILAGNQIKVSTVSTVVHVVLVLYRDKSFISLKAESTSKRTTKFLPQIPPKVNTCVQLVLVLVLYSSTCTKSMIKNFLEHQSPSGIQTNCLEKRLLISTGSTSTCTSGIQTNAWNRDWWFLQAVYQPNKQLSYTDQTLVMQYSRQDE
jgi:hypothetical protein